MPRLDLHVITPDGVVLEAPVERLQVRGLDGWVGLLPRHAPMLLALDVGLLCYAADGTRRCLFLSGGFLEVRGDRVRVVTDASEPADEIDVERARAAEERARERIEAFRRGPVSDIDLPRAEAALRRALWRLHASEWS